MTTLVVAVIVKQGDRRRRRDGHTEICGDSGRHGRRFRNRMLGLGIGTGRRSISAKRATQRAVGANELPIGEIHIVAEARPSRVGL